MELRAAEISEIIKQQIQGYDAQVELRETGTVLSASDGIARIHGLDQVASGELLQFPDEMFGLALNLEEDNVGAAVFGEVQAIKEGDEVRRTGRIAEVPVGDAMLGRVVNALGQPIDGKGPITSAESRRIEVKAPGIVLRQPVKEPVQTGLKAIDSMIPIGSRPARTHHRRPPDRQNRHRHRYDHQPEGRRHAVYLCRHRSEAVHRSSGG